MKHLAYEISSKSSIDFKIFELQDRSSTNQALKLNIKQTQIMKSWRSLISSAGIAVKVVTLPNDV